MFAKKFVRMFSGIKRTLSDQKSSIYVSSNDANLSNRTNFEHPELDLSSYTKEINFNKIEELYNELKHEKNKDINNLTLELLRECNKIPNSRHPATLAYGQTPKVIKLVQNKEFDFKIKTFPELVKNLKVFRNNNISQFTGIRSYYLTGDFAQLERALITFALRRLKEEKFKLVSVPDIIPSHVIERCGMSTQGDRTQVYYIDSRQGQDLCLSGTAEMALGGFLHDTVFTANELPQLFTSVSRCYRAETSATAEERGIYRVHQFTKVEMFGVSLPEESDNLLTKFLLIQEKLYEDLGLGFQVLDMPEHELGSPAYRKYDIEAWMPGRRMFGEISSCSNCTDYQSRRLGIKYKQQDGGSAHAHTVNGTACAIPRLILAIAETYQQPDGTIIIPEVLRPYMDGKQVIQRQKNSKKMV